MALSITDPAIQEQFRQDYINGSVPAWVPNAEGEAQAYVDYFNNLCGQEVMRLVAQVTYKFEVITPRG